jgi:hypothetical protein
MVEYTMLAIDYLEAVFFSDGAPQWLPRVKLNLFPVSELFPERLHCPLSHLQFSA